MVAEFFCVPPKKLKHLIILLYLGDMSRNTNPPISGGNAVDWHPSSHAGVKMREKGII